MFQTTNQSFNDPSYTLVGPWPFPSVSPRRSQAPLNGAAGEEAQRILAVSARAMGAWQGNDKLMAGKKSVRIFQPCLIAREKPYQIMDGHDDVAISTDNYTDCIYIYIHIYIYV